jgi:hypothetical protein
VEKKNVKVEDVLKLKYKQMNKRIITVGAVAVASVLGVTLLVCGVLWYLSGYGKCSFGKQLYFAETRSETCAAFGTKIDPIPSNVRILKVTRSPWTGWSRVQPEDDTQIYVIGNGTKEIVLDGLTGEEKYNLSINSFNEKTINLETDNLTVEQGSQLGSNSIDLFDCAARSFSVDIGGKAKLSTCSMDAGVTWTIEYL